MEAVDGLNSAVFELSLNKYGFEFRCIKVFFDLKPLELFDYPSFGSLKVAVSFSHFEILVLVFEVVLEKCNLLIAVISVFFEKNRVKAKDITLVAYDTHIIKIQLVIVFFESGWHRLSFSVFV